VEPEGILELPLHGLDVWVLHQECGAQLPVKEHTRHPQASIYKARGIFDLLS
jgi:hypothetical protein